MNRELRELDAALDLWACMWQPEEKERYETAVVRTLIDHHAPRTRRLALALCHAIPSARLHEAAARVVGRGEISRAELRWIEDVARERFRLLDTASRLQGNLRGVEWLLKRAVTGDTADDALLDVIDVRDLVAVARTTLDAKLFGEIEKRVARRGRYQRARAARLLEFKTEKKSGELRKTG